jgi:meso-butanediol dehydrogenase/(S,S)-butanediol dehydrogenase/diacetyl reductase
MEAVKTALVTNADAGLGRDLALELAESGMNVAIAGADDSRLLALACEIARIGRRAMIVRADFSKRNEADEAIERVVRAFGRIDLIANNTTFARIPATGETTTQEIENRSRLAVQSLLFGTLSAAETFRRQMAPGTIVNAFSVSGDEGVVLVDAWADLEEKVRHVTETAARGLASDGIAVRLYCPGVAATGLRTSAGLDPKSADALRRAAGVRTSVS